MLDVVFEMTVAQRCVTMVIGAAALVWAFCRYALPWLEVQEDVIDVALLVERQHQIDSDLVAALDFESSDAGTPGSARLKKAVIEHAARLGHELNVFEGFDYSPCVRRGIALAVTVLLVAIGVVLSPPHAGAFLGRMLLLSDRYPTATVIETIEVNGVRIDPLRREKTVVRVGHGKPVTFAVRCSGTIPEQGQVVLRSAASGKESHLVVAKTSQDEKEKNGFRGTLPRLLDTITYTLYVGDARTEPQRIEVIPLPVIQPTLRTIPPEYARQAEGTSETDTNSLQLFVIESSEVKIALRSSKPLNDAVLTIPASTEPIEYRLRALDEKNRHWALQDEGTVFSQVDQAIRFQLQVTDKDGLQLETPLEGRIRLKADRRPRVTGNLVHRVVLPGAKPIVELRASDDYGIDRLTLGVRVLRSHTRTGSPEAGTQTVQERDFPITALLEPSRTGGSDVRTNRNGSRSAVPLTFPVRRENIPLVGGYRLDLSKLDVDKGDQLELTLKVLDYRGKLPGRMTAGEPLVLNVSDKAGVLAAIAQSDEHSEECLTDIIRRQLGM